MNGRWHDSDLDVPNVAVIIKGSMACNSQLFGRTAPIQFGLFVGECR